jgi:cell division septation protein DedD
MRSDNSSIRNLEQIQEKDPSAAPSRLGTLLVASLAGACIAFAVFALARRPPAAKTAKPDPLADLASKAAPAASARTRSGAVGNDVAFPDLLSDEPNPTTALAVIREGAAAASASGSGAISLPPGVQPAGATVTPPPASDRLPVVPLPAQNYLSLSPVVTRPRDSLTAMAHQASAPSGPEAGEGSSGGYQLQVSSFRLQEEAQRFSTALRQRGHRAHVESALVPGKGTWFRVRVGPFKGKIEALKYRREFEQREHMVPFLVEPLDKLQVAQGHKGKMPHITD